MGIGVVGYVEISVQDSTLYYKRYRCEPYAIYKWSFLLNPYHLIFIKVRLSRNV